MENRLQDMDVYTIRLSLGLLGFAMLVSSFQAPAVSMCPFEAMASQNGRYVVAIVDETNVVIWDTERLRGGWQPVQVHGFQAPTALRPDRNIAVSADGKRLAYEDANANKLTVCDMKSGFPCRGALSLPDKANLQALEWSPDGLRLLVVTRLQKKGMLHLLSLNEIDEDQETVSREWQLDVPIVDWKRKRLAVGHANTLTLYDLETAEPIQTLKTLGYSKPLSFTDDSQNILVREEGVLRVYHIDSEADPGVVHMRAQISDHDQITGVNETLWYVKPTDGDNKQNWDLVPATAAGELDPNRKISLHTQRKVANILWIDARSQNALVHVFSDCQHNVRLINLRTGLVEFELYGSKVNYRSRDFTLPHLLPWLGADAGYRVVALPLHVPAALLQYAALATMLHDRYDAIWFGLLTALEPFALSTRGYSELLKLSAILVHLRQAEHFHKSGQSSDALIAADAAWGLLERMMPVLENVSAVDGMNPALISLVAAYLPVVRNDILLVRAQSAMALWKWKIAEVALNQILQTNPHDWRAYAGLIYLNLNSAEELFTPLLREAQETLRLEGWTAELKWGFPPQFFHEPTLQSLRTERQNEMHKQ